MSRAVVTNRAPPWSRPVVRRGATLFVCHLHPTWPHPTASRTRPRATSPHASWDTPPVRPTTPLSPATAASAAAAGGRVECSPRPRGWRRRYGRCNVAAAAGGTRACVAVVVAATTVGAIAARATAAAAAADGVADVADGGAVRRYYIPGTRVREGDRLLTKLAKAARCRLAHAHAEGRRL